MATVVARSTNLLLGLALLWLGTGIFGLAVAANVAMLLAIGFSYRRLSRYLRPRWQPDWSFWRRESAQPTALGLGIIFSIISFRLDNLLIPPLVGREALGLYNAGYKLFEPSAIIPAVVLAGTFPLLSTAADGRDGRLGQLLRQTLLSLLGLGALVSTTMGLLAEPVVTFLYGQQYAAATPVLQILALACLPLYVNYGLTHALIAMNRPHMYAGFTLAAMLANLASNLSLIPVLGIEGAAIATVLAELVLLACCAWAVARYTQRASSRPAEPAMKPGVEGLL
jgi:O-antigen/teichoic acid export membrane protein